MSADFVEFSEIAGILTPGTILETRKGITMTFLSFGKDGRVKFKIFRRGKDYEPSVPVSAVPEVRIVGGDFPIS